ncbi:hypothetical protein BS47DRAFT_1353438 [Hydnum rufescens UP504]|uniref:Uncharacterized protein n=1 Tax=Hydnum rufescens UP504 TaxID=1448309 RepID=A0A9P6AHT6_9AGAM|nr:hypothetical protein BS47DRAFT_1353438 [Hydnum rufescens UP504]
MPFFNQVPGRSRQLIPRPHFGTNINGVSGPLLHSPSLFVRGLRMPLPLNRQMVTTCSSNSKTRDAPIVQYTSRAPYASEKVDFETFNPFPMYIAMRGPYFYSALGDDHFKVLLRFLMPKWSTSDYIARTCWLDTQRERWR